MCWHTVGVRGGLFTAFTFYYIYIDTNSHALLKYFHIYSYQYLILEREKLRILDNEVSESANINPYKFGTVLVQGNRKQIQLDFHLIKEIAQQEKLSLVKNTPTLNGSDQTSSLHKPTDEQLQEESQPPNTEYYSLIEMKDKFTQLEVRQLELEQQVITLQSA